MTIQEIAARLRELCQQGKYEEAQTELFADNAVSIEPEHSPGMQSVEGLEAIKQKGQAFQSMVEEIHGGYVTEPAIAGNHFAVGAGLDLTMKGQGRVNMEEICLYEVKDGKIVKEQFFY